MIKGIKLTWILIGLSTSIFLYLLIVKPPFLGKLVYRQQFEQSERLITAIETFELEEGDLPTEKEVTELKIRLGLPADERCPCYQLEENGRFIVWFGYQSTGSSMIYDSSTAEWAHRH